MSEVEVKYVRLDAGLVAKLKHIAIDDRTTIRQIIEDLIRDDLKKRGSHE